MKNPTRAPEALLYKKVALPDEFVRERTGGDIRIGDLDGDGRAEVNGGHFGNLRPELPARELAIRYNGHHADVMIVAQDGVVLNRFRVDEDESPNNTGMEIVRWNGPDHGDLLYSPAALFNGHGHKVATFPELPAPSGGKMGWYHCFPADVCGDEREEVVLYDPYGDAVYIYTPAPLDESRFDRYHHGPRQYNARLLD